MALGTVGLCFICHITATSWSIPDTSAPDFCKSVYLSWVVQWCLGHVHKSDAMDIASIPASHLALDTQSMLSSSTKYSWCDSTL